jgi:hypothetical protein
VAATLEEAKAQFKRRYPEDKGGTDGVANPDLSAKLASTTLRSPCHHLRDRRVQEPPHRYKDCDAFRGVQSPRSFIARRTRESRTRQRCDASVAVVTPGLDRSLIERTAKSNGVLDALNSLRPARLNEGKSIMRITLPFMVV